MEFNKLNELKLNYASITHLKYRLHRNELKINEKLRSGKQMWFGTDELYRDVIEKTSTVDVCFFNNKVKLNEFMNISFSELSLIVNDDLYNIIKNNSEIADNVYETVSINEKFHKFSLNDSNEYYSIYEMLYPMTNKSLTDYLYENLSKLNEKDGIVTDFDNYIDDMTYEILRTYNQYKRTGKISDEYSDYAYYSLYDASTKPITKDYKCDIAEYHQHNGVMEKHWHKILYQYVYIPNADFIMGTSRLLNNEKFYARLSEEQKLQFYTDDVHIYVNISRNLNYENVITNLLHELTHVKVMWNNDFKDVTMKRKGKLGCIDIDKFSNLTNTLKNLTRFVCYLTSKYERSAFINAMRRNALIHLDRYKKIINNGINADNMAIVIVGDTFPYNNCNNMANYYNIVNSYKYSNREEMMSVLLIAYYLRYHNYFWIDSKLLNKDYLLKLIDNPDIRIREHEWNRIHAKISKLLLDSYQVYQTECLRQAKKIAISIGAK